MTDTTTDLDAWLAEVNQAQFGWLPSLRWTYDATRQLLADGIPGDLVECGVAAGVHPAAMWKACADSNTTGRTVHLLDSFEGVPHGSSEDRTWNREHGDGSGRLESTGVAAVSLTDVMANLARWCPPAFDPATANNLPFAFHPGWFQQTLPKIAPRFGPIAFLRLDGDLFDSTLCALNWLYPKLADGGILVVDDLELDGCRAAVRDYGLSLSRFEMITESGDGWLRKG